MGDENLAVAQQKAITRKHASAARSLLHENIADDAKLAIAEHGMAFLRQYEPAILAGFMPFGSEIDPRPLLTKAMEAGWKIALPVVVEQDAPLIFRHWTPDDTLIPGMWSIPIPEEKADVLEPDVMLVPLLAYDKKGHRLGYGGGFYDRTIEQVEKVKPLIAIGTCFHQQKIDAVPNGDLDQPLKWILSEQGMEKITPLKTSMLGSDTP